MNALEWKSLIEMPNNSAFIARERKNSRSVYVFSATPFSADSILKSAQKLYPKNQVVMNIRKCYDYGNTYEIYTVVK